jgi:hypothetical protein
MLVRDRHRTFLAAVGLAGASVVASTLISGPNATADTPRRPDYSAVVLADQPFIYWRLDDANGSSTMTDASGNGNNGTYSRARRRSCERA